jgi:hypothetical protein
MDEARRSALAQSCRYALDVVSGTVRVAAPGPAIDADSSFQAALKQVMIDSLNGGGSQSAQVLVARDRATSRALKSLGIPVEEMDRRDLRCPASSDSVGALLPPPVGYSVGVEMTPTCDGQGWLVDISKSCTFIYRGSLGPMAGFGESARFEFRRSGKSWRLVRTVGHLIT